MTTTYRVLGQSNPVAATNTNLYTVPASRAAVLSTLAVCNQGAATTFRVAVRPAGAAIAAQHFIAHNVDLPASDTVFLTLGITLATTDIVTVFAGTATVSFSLFGAEMVV